MTGILLVALQILLLLLKAHFSKNGDQEKALENIREAQAKLGTVAAALELKLRYSGVPPAQIDHLEDLLDSNSKDHHENK